MSFLKITDVSKEEFYKILENGIAVKNNPKVLGKPLEGKNIGLYFEKPSTRTRISFEVGINQLGGNVIHLNSKELQISRGESVEDTARVLSRYLDGLVIRSYSHETIEKFSQYVDFPVINALSDLYHPCQSLADYMTIMEYTGKRDDIHICFTGDGDNNVAHSLILSTGLSGNSITISSPKNYQPSSSVINEAKELGGNVYLEEMIGEKCLQADALYTDVWISMGNESESEIRKRELKPFQINLDVIKRYSKPPVILHCLPANKGQEIDEAAFYSESSRIFDQAENRLHAQKALLHYLYT